MKIQKRGLPNQEETPINIESPVEKQKDKEELEETKPKRERKKKKKELKKIERPTLYTYTVIGYVKNSQGRFKFTDIIEAQDKNIASDIYKQRAKKEFSAVRAINKIEVNDFKEGDIKSSEEIKEEIKPIEVSKKDSFTDEELARYVLNTIIHVNNCNIYKVLYYPSKKKSLIKKAPRLYYMADNEMEARQFLREEVTEQTGEFNEKWVQSISVVNLDSLNDIMETGIYKSVLRRVKELSQELREILEDFYTKADKLTSGTLTEDDKKDLLDVLLEIPKMILSKEEDDEHTLEKMIGDLKIKGHQVSVGIESIDKGLKINDTGHTDSILGKQYSLHIETNKGKIVEIKPVVSAIMNPALFKMYKIHSERNGVELIDSCDVMAESEDKASDYIIFVCKKMELIKKNDTIKTNVFLDGKQVAGYICKI